MLVDANLLIYVHDDSSPRHEAARSWLEGRLNEPRRVGIPWVSIIAFLRLTTVSADPSTSDQAWQHVDSWFTHHQRGYHSPRLGMPRYCEDWSSVTGSRPA